MGQTPGQLDCLLLVPEADAEQAHAMLQTRPASTTAPAAAPTKSPKPNAMALDALVRSSSSASPRFDPPRWACRNCGKQIR